MNKEQEALDYLSGYCGAWEDEHQGELIETNKRTSIIQELVDRATPMKPKEIYATAMGLRLGVCPLCGITVFEGMGCPKCLQALDWK